MIHFNNGSLVHKLVMLLSFLGEYPTCSLHLMGNERVVKELVHRLTMPQMLRNDGTGEAYTGKLLTISGKGREKTIRLYKSALPIMDWLHPDAYGYYMSSFRKHRFSGDAAHKERNHRIAEAAVLCMEAGVESRPYLLPALQGDSIRRTVPEMPAFYLSKDIKKVGGDEMNKIMFTRMTGVLFSGDECYAVYNTRGSVMKWNGIGEFKAMHSLTGLGRMNAGVETIDTAVLIGRDNHTALQTMLATDSGEAKEFRFDAVYRHIHFIAMDKNGIFHLKLMILPKWKNRLMELLFDEEERCHEKGLFEYDAFVDGVYVFSFLDSDIARLLRFKSAVLHTEIICEVLCFPYQLLFLKEYLGETVRYKTIEMELVAEELGIR
mgnify:CR=1 FL=1